MKALVIDDSRSIRSIMNQYLKDIGFTVVEAQHGEEAMEKIKNEGPFDVAFVDWNMPIMNGYEFVVAVRKQAALNGLILVMVTTETEMERVIQATQAGANEYIMKPFTKDIIKEKLSILGILKA